MFLVSKFIEVKSCFYWSKKLFYLQKNMAEVSGKGKTRQSNTIQIKKDVVSYAVNHSNWAAASKFNIEPKCVREWRSAAEKFNTVKVNRKQIRKSSMLGYSMRQKMLHASLKMIMLKANKIFDDKTTDLASRDAFVTSRGWCEKFMRCRGFSLRWKTTTVQKDHSYLIDLLVSMHPLS